METVQYLSKSAYAAYRGVSPGYVTKLKGLGRLVFAPDGKSIDVAATDLLLSETADPSKAAVAARHEGERVAKGVTAFIAPGAPLTETPPTTIGKPDFQKARAHREHFLALLAEDEYLKQHGQLADVTSVENAAFATGRMLRDLLLGLPKQISPEIAAITDPWEVERLLTAGIRRVLEDADRVSASDLVDALKPSN